MKTEISKFTSSKGVITTYKLTNNIGASVTLSSVGAGIVSVIVPDSQGNMADVVLGYADVRDYLYDGPCAGKIAGRFANRIAKGELTIDGTKYALSVNCGPNHKLLLQVFRKRMAGLTDSVRWLTAYFG